MFVCLASCHFSSCGNGRFGWISIEQEVAKIAGWEDEQIEYLKEKISKEGKEEDLKKGKAEAQVVVVLYSLIALLMFFLLIYIEKS